MSEAEKPELKPGKRIVSRGRYAFNVVVKGMAYSVIAMQLLIGVACLITVVALFSLVFRGKLIFFFGVFVSALLLATSVHMFHLTRRTIKEVNQMDTGIPLTRVNTGDLPTPESLVRASAEPLQAQETVLLRAAAQASETATEQLVRPAGGQE